MRIKNRIITLSSLIVLPLNVNSWKQLEFRNIKANTVSTIKQNGDHLKISVSQSASPLVYKFDKPKRIKSLNVEARLLSGSLDFHGITQGASGADDFLLRVGLVAKGNQQLNFLQKIVAPSWVKELHRMGKESTGIDKIYFYNIASEALSWNERIHPRSNLIVEKIVGKIQNNKIQFTVIPDQNKEILGLWISSDGDDSKSNFDLEIEKISVDEI